MGCRGEGAGNICVQVQASVRACGMHSPAECLLEKQRETETETEKGKERPTPWSCILIPGLITSTRWRCLPVPLPQRFKGLGPGQQSPHLPRTHCPQLNLYPLLCSGSEDCGSQTYLQNLLSLCAVNRPLTQAWWRRRCWARGIRDHVPRED